jgi:hypothetical protein
MAVGDFDTFYPDNPWAGITTKERIWYDPILRDIFRKINVFAQFTTFVQNLANRNAKTMTITSLYDVHPNTDSLGLRDMWLPASHIDSRAVDITFNRYGGKVAYHVYDDIITYWQESGGGASALRRIVNDKLGRHMADVQDLLSRNALLSVPYKLYASGGSDFSALTTEDKLTTTLLDEVHLGMQYRDVPYAQSPVGNVGTIVGIISPGVYYDLQQQSEPKDWITRMAYAAPTRLLNYELGTFRNVRWVVTPKATLFNSGAITAQVAVSAAITAGDGSPDPGTTKVDSAQKVGQPAAVHYIQLATTDEASATVNSTYMNANFKVNDIVTVHVGRTSANGITNGVDFTDGKLSNRRIVAIDATNRRLTFDQPIMVDMKTDLGSGKYAFVTKGLHVHASMFIGGPDAVVNGVGRPPRLHTPPPVDDFDSIYRFSWDSYQGYQVYNPSVCEVIYSAGSVRMVGDMLQG